MLSIVVIAITRLTGVILGCPFSFGLLCYFGPLSSVECVTFSVLCFVGSSSNNGIGGGI